MKADETYIGKRETPAKLSRGRIATPTKSGKAGGAHKRVVIGLVERGGKVRTFHINHATKDSVRDVLVSNVSRDTNLITDESRLYTETGKEYASHKTTKHSRKEYVRYEDGFAIHSNTIEGVFSVFKRGMIGVYQHCGEAHLHRYLAEFDFRYNRRTALKISDAERAEQLLAGARGKRLTYRRADESADAQAKSAPILVETEEKQPVILVNALRNHLRIFEHDRNMEDGGADSLPRGAPPSTQLSQWTAQL